MSGRALFELGSGLVPIFLAVVYYLFFTRRTRNVLPLPPGPKGYPLIGNLLSISYGAMWEKYHEWSQKFGNDVIYLNVAGQGFVVLNSSEAAMELLERRSLIYSDRPTMPMLTDLMGLDFSVALAQYGDQLRAQHKLIHQVFNPAAAKNLRPHVLKAAYNVLGRFIDRPGDVTSHLRHMAGETIMAITYGLEAQPDNDPYIDISEEANRAFIEASLPGAYLVNSFPILKYVPEWVPGAGFQKKAREWKMVIQNMLNMPFAAATRNIDSGNYKPSFVSHSCSRINENEDLARQQYLIKGAAATLYSAGSDTTSATISWCIIALLNHPDVLKRAHEEIDSVLPFGNLPTFDDEGKLPFITAICMEAMRWRAIAPIGFPHLLTKDDTFNGYRIPKGSFVIANAWAILNNETIYPDPFSFKPERFLKDGKINKDVRDPAHAAFGFGRRMCSGRYMALSAIWITVASIIAAFDITMSRDASGNIIRVDPNEEAFVSILRIPKPFMCAMKPRSKIHELMIRTMIAQDLES